MLTWRINRRSQVATPIGLVLGLGRGCSCNAIRVRIRVGVRLPQQHRLGSSGLGLGCNNTIWVRARVRVSRVNMHYYGIMDPQLGLGLAGHTLEIENQLPDRGLANATLLTLGLGLGPGL